ncbi:MAG TPA: HAD family hydrolase [Beutenbergiaceae bacterium]|nr:HAD family hydrolase [Beutenbergiaceae bacterium]
MTPDFFPGALLTLRSGPQTLVALDIDGTILGHDGSLSQAMIDAVHALIDEGTHVVLSTGRSIPAVTPIIDALGLPPGWAICSNGAVTIRYESADDYEIEDVVTFDPGPTLRKMREHAPDALFAVEDVGTGFKLSHEFPMGELSGKHIIVPFEELCDTAASRVTVRDPQKSAADFHELVRRSGLHGVSYAVGWTAWLDISPEGVSKASALDVVRQRLRVEPGATLAAGDGHNDIEMLGWAEYGIAMGDADDTTRAAADYVTGPVREDGLVPVLRSFLPQRVL